MVCAGCIGNTPEIIEVSILILCSDVLLNACSVVCPWQCCTSCPVTVAMISSSLMWLLFLSFFIFWWTVQHGSRTRSIFMKISYSSTLSVTGLTKSCWCYQYPIPTKAYCSKVSSRRCPLGLLSTFPVRCLKHDHCSSSLACLMCVFSVRGVRFLLPQFSHTSSGSMGPSAPWGASVWSRRMGLLHMGHTLRISSHLSRHFLWNACEHGHTPSSSLVLNSSRHTAQVCPRRLSFLLAPFSTTSL